jgi:hypothetical protein
MTDPREDGRPDPAGDPRGVADDAFRGAGADARPVPASHAPAPAATPVRRHPVRRFFGWWMVLGLIAAVCVVCLAMGLSAFDTPVHIVVDGDDFGGASMTGATFAVKALVFAGVAAVGLFLLLLVPLIVLLALGLAAFALIAGFGTPLVILAFALALLSSPVWLVVLVFWLLARRRRAHSATMAA